MNRRRLCGTGEVGTYRHAEYRAWWNMVMRCTDPENAGWAHYGGRGIGVCRTWQRSFAAFFRDVGHRPGPEYSIDRIDNEGHYKPGNCRWATKREQTANRRPNQGHYRITIDGVTRSLEEWARFCGIAAPSVYSRLRSGWTIERALTTPAQRLAQEQAQ